MKIIILSGATATGKTALAISLAKKYNLEIINFDSLLFYRELNIGTSKPTQEEMESIPHHLIGFQSAKNPINAADFARLASKKISDLHQRGVVPLLVGGSCFYLQALLQGMGDQDAPSNEVMEKSNSLYESEGISPFLEILSQNDPINFKRLHQNDHYRIRRAVEYFWFTNKPFSLAKKSPPPPWHQCHLYLDLDKTKHWEIIGKRTKEMLQKGLLEEIRHLLSNGFTGKERPLRAIGYKEGREYLNKEISNLAELEERITISTRQLAKAQKTFFSKIAVKKQFNPIEDQSLMEKETSLFLNSPES